MTVYYNENDPAAAAWLRELIKEGHIAHGEVDERSIWDVAPGDLSGFRQCHFFAGIGGWSYALRLAGWPDDRPVWTGSCPCQPFSQAGKREGFSDERHLWPAFFHLIQQRRPGIVFGEQVASALEWLDLVFDDCEGAGYACWAEDLCAAGVGSPQIRQRLFWVAGAGRIGDEPDRRELGGAPGTVQGQAREQRVRPDAWDGCSAFGMAGGLGSRLEVERKQPAREECEAAERGGAAGKLADIEGDGRGEEPPHGGGGSAGDRAEGLAAGSGASRAYLWPGAAHDGWAGADWLLCRDGKWRPVEPGTFPLAHGVSGRVGLLRGYGNAIVPQVAAEFIMGAWRGVKDVPCKDYPPYRRSSV